MTTSVGAGIILCRLTNQTIEFLLLRGTETNIWSFSKGHPERCDQFELQRTAIRETKEETGLIAEQDYTIVAGPLRFGKRPYWIGILTNNNIAIRLSPREHNAAQWFSHQDIQKLSCNADVRVWFRKTACQLSSFWKILQCYL